MCLSDVHASRTSFVSAEGEFDLLQLALCFVDENSRQLTQTGYREDEEKKMEDNFIANVLCT